MKCKVRTIGKGLLVILFLGIIFLAYLYMNNDIGIQKSKLEVDIRSSQKVNDDWIVEGDVSETMAAYISYPEDQSDHTFSVYVNRPGVSFGYFFRGGGSLNSIATYIGEYTVEGYNERAFISMNTMKVDKLTIDDGKTVEEIDIDCNNPFAIVLPINTGTIIFYDVNGNQVDSYENVL